MGANAFSAFVRVDLVILISHRNRAFGTLGHAGIAVGAIIRDQQGHFFSVFRAGYLVVEASQVR